MVAFDWKNLGSGPLILLFYDGFERQASRSIAGKVRSAARGTIRTAYRRLRKRQVYTGFYVAFRSLVFSLRSLGYDVRVNDFAIAGRLPDYPIGVAGYPSVIAKVASLPNPILFGPGSPGSPLEAREALLYTNIKRIIQPSSWYADLYAHYCGSSVVRWPVPVDLGKNLKDSSLEKRIDVLIYDKIRWNREEVFPRIIDRLKSHIKNIGLSYVVVKYGSHTNEDYLDKLRTSRSFAFICEHETQGLACQEAMAMNIPVFAWDEGELIDPIERAFMPEGLVASSVPYFDESCGLRFREAKIEESFDTFWHQLGKYEPRLYVMKHLDSNALMEEYIEHLWSTVLPSPIDSDNLD